MVPPSCQHSVGVCNQIILLVLYYISSTLVTLLEVTDAPIQVSDILVITVSFSSSLISAVRYSFFLFLKCLLALWFTLFRLSILLWFGSHNLWILTCLLWSKNCEHSSSNHGLCCFHSYRPTLSLAEILRVSLMFSQALFMFSLSFKFSKAGNLFETLIWYCFLNSGSLAFLRLNLFCDSCLLTYCQSFPNFCNHQIVISITVSFPKGSCIEYTLMPSPIYLYMINMIVRFPSRRGPGVFMNVSVLEHRALNNQIFWCGKVYYSNTIIITILM